MSTSPRTARGRRLKPFRLSDVPIDLRLAAARAVANRGSSGLPDDGARADDRLFARLLSDRSAGGETASHEALRRVAASPSPRVYWISREAWERVMR